MTNEEIKNLLTECSSLYATHSSMYKDPKISKEWFKTLSNYDKKDIYASLERHKEGAYSRIPIVLIDLVRNVPTIKDKENKNYANFKVYCKNCGRLVPYAESEQHEDRCRSVEYIINQYKKWFHKEITASYLWSLPDYEFEEKYNQLLKYIYEHTTSEEEKKIIGYIFNPPSEEETKNFFGVQNE